MQAVGEQILATLANISPKNKFFAIIAVLVLSASLIAFLIWFYVLPLIQKEGDAIIAMKIELATLEAKRHQIKKTEYLLQESDNDLKRIAGLIVDSSNPLNFFESLYSIASSSNVSIDANLTTTPSTNADAKPDFGISMRLGIVGTGRGIYTFLNMLELLPFQIEIQDLFISGGGSTFRLDTSIKALSR